MFKTAKIHNTLNMDRWSKNSKIYLNNAWKSTDLSKFKPQQPVINEKKNKQTNTETHSNEYTLNKLLAVSNLYETTTITTTAADATSTTETTIKQISVIVHEKI